MSLVIKEKHEEGQLDHYKEEKENYKNDWEEVRGNSEEEQFCSL